MGCLNRLQEYFEYRHLPEHLQVRSKIFHDLASKMAVQAWGAAIDFDQYSLAMQKLLEAKDCFVRAFIVEESDAS